MFNNDNDRPALGRPRGTLRIVSSGAPAPRIPTATEDSKQIHRSQWRDIPNAIDCNPGTTVHELVEKLIQLAGMTIEQYQACFPLPDPETARR